MPIIKSAKKRVRQTTKRTAKNVKTKKSLRHAIKSFTASLKSGKDTSAHASKAQSAIDTAAKKGLIHKNKAARKKKQLAAASKKAGAKPVAAAKKATAPKKAVVKKAAPAKKPATKKAPVKKAAAKK